MTDKLQDTPRTDAEFFKYVGYEFTADMFYKIHDFTRNIEKELNAKAAKLDELRQDFDALHAIASKQGQRIATLEASLVQLREDAALACENQIFEHTDDPNVAVRHCAEAIRAIHIPEKAEGIKRVLEAAKKFNSVPLYEATDALIELSKAVQALEAENK